MLNRVFTSNTGWKMIYLVRHVAGYLKVEYEVKEGIEGNN